MFNRCTYDEGSTYNDLFQPSNKSKVSNAQQVVALSILPKTPFLLQ